MDAVKEEIPWPPDDEERPPPKQSQYYPPQQQPIPQPATQPVTPPAAPTVLQKATQSSTQPVTQQAESLDSYIKNAPSIYSIHLSLACGLHFLRVSNVVEWRGQPRGQPRGQKESILLGDQLWGVL